MKAPKIATPEVYIIKDKEVLKTKVSFDSDTPKYVIKEVQINEKPPQIVTGNSFETINKETVNSVSITTRLDTDKIREEFSVDIAKDQRPTITKVVNFTETSAKIDVSIEKDYSYNESSFISNCFVYNNKGGLNVFFFVDIENLVKERSVYSSISKNIEYTDELLKGVQIIDYKIYRERVYENSFNGDFFKFDENQSVELVNTKLEMFYEFKNNIISYKFIDEDLPSISFGDYRYIVELYFNDPLTAYIEKGLRKLEELLQLCNNSNKKQLNFENNFVEEYKKYEKMFYGNNSNTYIFDSESFSIFNEKLFQLYYKLYNYYNDFSSYEKTIIAGKDFKEVVNVDRYLNLNKKINKISKLTDIITWVEEKNFNIDGKIYKQDSTTRASAINVRKINKEILNDKDTEDKTIVLDFAYNYNVDINYDAIEIFKLLNAVENSPSFIQILDSFDMSVYGDNWIKLDESNRNDYLKNKDFKLYLCRMIDNTDDIPIDNQYFLIENN